MNFVRLSIERPVTTIMGILFFVVMGAFSYSLVPVDMLPKFDVPMITIVTVYPGADPENIETLVSKPIEEAVSSINGIEKLISNSFEGFSNVIIEFKETIDVDIAANDVRDKISAIRADLPDDIREPVIMKLDINALPIISIAVEGPQTIEEIYRVVSDDLKDEFSKVPGVAEVEIIGNREREILVQAPFEKLKAYDLSITSIAGLIAQKSHNIPSGHITGSRSEYSVRMEGEFKSVDEIRNLPIPLRNGKTIPLSVIASVDDDFEELRQSVRFNRNNAIGIIIKKRSDANTVQTSHGVQNLITDLSDKIPEGMKINITRNRADFIEDSVSDLNDNLLLGAIITGIVLFLFLHSLKSTLIAIVSLPVAIVGSYLLIYLFGFTINVITLMALAISVGILVNNAIIVIENIISHLQRGKSPKQAAEDGTNEILTAVSGATLTNVVVFLPIAFMSGIIGKIFYQFGLTVTFATLLSLLAAFSVTPMLCARYLKSEDADEKKSGRFAQLWDGIYTSLERDYARALRFCLARRALTTILGSALLVGSLPLAGHIGFEFITEPDQQEFDITIKTPPGTSLAITDRVLQNIEARVAEISNLRYFFTKLGKTENIIGGASDGVNRGEITVKLKKNSAEPTDKVISKLTPFLADIPSVELNVRKTGIMGSMESPIQIYVVGDEFEKLHSYSAQVADIVRKTRGTTDIQIGLESGKPEINIIPDRARMSRYGLSELSLAMQLRGYFEGDTNTKFRELDDEYEIRIRLAGNVRNDAKGISNLQVALPTGKCVPLTHVAKISSKLGPSQIDRFERNRTIKISSNISGRSMGEIAQDIRTQIDKLQWIPGYRCIFSGEVERMEDSFRSLITAMFQALIFTYMLLAVLMESFLHPVTILMSFPFAFCGIILSMFLTGFTISIFSLMAVVMLVGIVVNNGILMLEQIALLRKEGMELAESIVQGCSQKLRPIIMTAAATIFAMIPLAIGMGAGGEMRAPMAVISIGGLLASTMLSLFLIPVFYHFTENLLGKAVINRRTGQAERRTGFRMGRNDRRKRQTKH